MAEYSEMRQIQRTLDRIVAMLEERLPRR